MHVKQTSTAERDAMIANLKKILADFDADGDGQQSRDEAPILLKAQFDRYDTDHDGFISLDDAQGLGLGRFLGSCPLRPPTGSLHSPMNRESLGKVTVDPRASHGPGPCVLRLEALGRPLTAGFAR